MIADGPIGIRVQVAVCNADPGPRPAVRLVLMVMAVLANRKTGIGLSGQQRLARATGLSVRAVREVLAELNECRCGGEKTCQRCLSPVRVERRRRGLPGGAGRNSDEYRLALSDEPQAAGAASSVEAAKRQELPLEQVPTVEPPTQAAASATSSGRSGVPQAAAGAGDPRSLRSEKKSEEAGSRAGVRARDAINGSKGEQKKKRDPALLSEMARFPDILKAVAS